MKATIGRVVHYWENGEENAAIVINCKGETVALKVFKRHGGDLQLSVVKEWKDDGSPKDGVWTWPKKEE